MNFGYQQNEDNQSYISTFTVLNTESIILRTYNMIYIMNYKDTTTWTPGTFVIATRGISTLANRNWGTGNVGNTGASTDAMI